MESEKGTKKKSGIRNSGIPCCKCHKLQARYSDGACRKCHFLILGEGIKPSTIKETNAEKHTRLRKERVRKFNALAKKGWNREQIAEALDMHPAHLSHYMRRMRNEGVKPAPVRLDGKIEPQPPIEPPRQIRADHVVEHGGGKRGIKGCNCVKCLDVRRSTHNALVAKRKARSN